MRDPENLRRIEALEVDYVGFIFYRQSSRCIFGHEASVEEAIRRCGKNKIGVFVNETPERILPVAESYRLNGVQLHGEESPATCLALRKAGYTVIKAFPVAAAGGGAAEDFARRTEVYAPCADYFLFDTKCAGYGGSGLRFDWSLLDRYRGGTPFLLSGGLAPTHLPELLSLKHPQFAGIDLNSGFETAPALKNLETLSDFIHKIRPPYPPHRAEKITVTR
jgi:phosphoribosylanthranilate isomerase